MTSEQFEQEQQEQFEQDHAEAVDTIQHYHERMDQVWEKYLENPKENKDLLFIIMYIVDKIRKMEKLKNKLEKSKYNADQRTEKFKKTIDLLQKSGSYSALIKILCDRLSQKNETSDLEDQVEKQMKQIDELRKENEELKNKEIDKLRKENEELRKQQKK